MIKAKIIKDGKMQKRIYYFKGWIERENRMLKGELKSKRGKSFEVPYMQIIFI